jgi:hypothetical protein
MCQVGVDGAALNSLDLLPVKSSETNCMSFSSLQLAAGTVVLFDETSGDGDALTLVGRRSLQAVRGVISSQLLTVECEYCNVEIPTNLPCLLLSSAKDAASTRFGDSSSVLQVPVAENISCGSSAADSIGRDWSWSTSARLWWAVVRLIEPSMTEDTLRMAETDFVMARNTPLVSGGSQFDENLPLSVDIGDFHHWLSLARLMAVSNGETSITVDHWRRVQLMETQRMQRLHSVRK